MRKVRKDRKPDKEEIRKEVFEGFQALIQNHSRATEDLRSEGLKSLGLSAGIKQALNKASREERREILREIDPMLEKWAEEQGIDYKKAMTRAAIVRSCY